MSDAKAKYVDFDVAVNGLAKIINESDMPEEWNKGMSAAMLALFRIPAADVRPVARVSWVKRRFGENCVGYECLNCHTTWDAPTNYCPNCGAMMEEK